LNQAGDILIEHLFHVTLRIPSPEILWGCAAVLRKIDFLVSNICS